MSKKNWSFDILFIHIISIFLGGLLMSVLGLFLNLDTIFIILFSILSIAVYFVSAILIYEGYFFDLIIRTSILTCISTVFWHMAIDTILILMNIFNILPVSDINQRFIVLTLTLGVLYFLRIMTTSKDVEGLFTVTVLVPISISVVIWSHAHLVINNITLYGLYTTWRWNIDYPGIILGSGFIETTLLILFLVILYSAEYTIPDRNEPSELDPNESPELTVEELIDKLEKEKQS